MTFKEWVRDSREQQRRAPERYLAFYPELVMDDKSVLLTQETLDKIERNCGRYDGCLPTGQILGKMFLRGELSSYGSESRKEDPQNGVSINFRRIVVVE
jgi:hypothetical protein